MGIQEVKPRIIRVYNKKAKTTYLYEDIAYWDPEQKQGRHKRKGIGKLDSNGKPVYNDYYKSRLGKQTAEGTRAVFSTTLIGERLILDKIIKDTGLKTVLDAALGKQKANLALQLIQYIVCESKPLCYSGEWLKHRGFSAPSLCCQQITDFLRSLDTNTRNTFYAKWLEKKSGRQSLLFAISSIFSSAHDCLLEQREDSAKQELIHIALISNYESNVPLLYFELPDDISEQAVLEFVSDNLEKMNVGQVGFILKRSFYSGDNIQKLTHNNRKFTMPVPSHIKWQNDFIDHHRSSLRNPANLIMTDDKSCTIYGMTMWKDTKYGRMCYHLYYDAGRKQRDDAMLRSTLRKCQDDLENGREFKSRKQYYKRFFRVRLTSKLERKVILKEDEVNAYINGYSGYLVLLSNEEKDTAKALSHYRQLNSIELHFDDIKNLMDCDLLKLHSEDVIQGRLFMNFLALIIVNELKRFVDNIPDKNRNHWDYSTILNKVASYSRIRYKGKSKDAFTAPNKSQRLIFDLFGIKYMWKGKVVNDDLPSAAEDHRA